MGGRIRLRLRRLPRYLRAGPIGCPGGVAKQPLTCVCHEVRACFPSTLARELVTTR